MPGITGSQFTATGPATIGFQTQPADTNTHFSTGLDVSGVYTGVRGTGTIGQVVPPIAYSAGIGVQGNGSGVGWGVAGYGGNATPGTVDVDPSASAGVRGQGGQGPQAGGPGVFGLGGTGSGVGVFGQGAPALGSTEPGGPGVRGIGGGSPNDNADGVQGFGVGTFTGVVGWGDPNANGSGVVGFGGTVNSATNAGGPGVRGIGAGAPNVMPPPLPGGFPNPVGVFGVGGGSSDPKFASPINGAGVIGIGGSSTKPNAVGNDADGVQGFGVGTFSGVAGFGGGSSGTGAFGLGGGPSGPGVRGIGAGGPFTASSGPVGVYGQGGPNSDGVQGVGNGVGAAGVRGFGSFGVHAIAGPNNGDTAVYADGHPGAIGIFASGGQAGFFAGDVVVNASLSVDHDLTVSGNFSVLSPGIKSAVVPFPDGSHRQLYCMESPESWFEDFGSGHLTNGRAEIQLDPDFAATVSTDDYHVFTAEYDDNNALFVTNRTRTGFEVRAKTSTSAAKFSYRVVARRKDIAPARLAKVTLPKARDEAVLARLKSARA
jgi:hypothetical protein